MTEESDAFVREALGHYRLSVEAVAKLADSFNTLFTVRGGAQTYLLRVGPTLRIHEVGAARAEAEWTEELAAAGLTVPRLISSIDGRAAVSVADGDASRICTVATWIDGEVLPRPMSAADAVDLGRLAARLHAASPPRTVRSPGALDGRRVLLFELPDLLDRAADAPTFRAAARRSQAAVDRLWQQSSAPRLVHGDLTASNVVRTAAGLVPIDFQDMFWGHPQQDIAYSLFSYLRHDYDTLAAAFRAGYEQVQPWPDFEAAALEDLFAARRLLMANLAIALERPGLDDYLAVHAAALRTYASGSASGSDGVNAS